MKATLTFNLPEDHEEHEDAMNGSKYKYILDEVGNTVFRPARKHGYPDARIQKLMEALDTLSEKYGPEVGLELGEWGTAPGGTELVSMLEDLFYSVKNEET